MKYSELHSAGLAEEQFKSRNLNMDSLKHTIQNLKKNGRFRIGEMDS